MIGIANLGNLLLNAFARMTPPAAFFWIVVENLLLTAGAILLGHLLILIFARRPVTGPAPPVEPLEFLLASVCVLMNSATTFLGWILWKQGVIVIRREAGSTVFLDALCLLLIMDLAMYVLHRLAHAPYIFPWLHSLHHRYDHPRPLTLFVMNPLETLAFGLLWVGVLCVYHPTFGGIAIYLTLNVIFGTIGHLGVEPLPERWQNNRFFRWLGGSHFHAGHHVEPDVNFGFYTTFWDRLFRTLQKG